jgi:hypothetical protein
MLVGARRESLLVIEFRGMTRSQVTKLNAEAERAMELSPHYVVLHTIMNPKTYTWTYP